MMIITTFIATLVLFLFIFIAMSLGYIMEHKELQVSCKWLSDIGIEKVCDCQQSCNTNRKHAAAKVINKQIDE